MKEKVLMTNDKCIEDIGLKLDKIEEAIDRLVQAVHGLNIEPTNNFKRPLTMNGHRDSLNGVNPH
jgi:hypothetical protein